MNERELRDALREAGDGDVDARERSWRIVQRAYADYEPGRSRRRPRVALAVAGILIAATAALGGAAASAPDGEVAHLVRGVLGLGERGARPALGRLPGGGSLLVEVGDSVWVVSSDGGKRRLGTYSGASWSPRGLFVVAWKERVLSALDRRGRMRWSLARPEGVAAARWGAVDGFRVAYLAGGTLRIVNGDGTGDHRYGPAQEVAPAWRPDDTHVLAYVDARGRVNVVAVDSRRRLWRSSRLSRPAQLSWSPDGSRLLALTARRLWLFDGSGRPLVSQRLTTGFGAEDAVWAPRGSRLAVVRHDPATSRSEIALLGSARDRSEQTVFAGPGRFGRPAWSPNGRWLLLPWAEADQWLFLRARRGERLIAVTNIAAQFTPGARRPPFPRSVQWCCSTPPQSP